MCSVTLTNQSVLEVREMEGKIGNTKVEMNINHKKMEAEYFFLRR